MNGKQLKNSILQLAIQGKLVPQDPNDEPASELLKRIRKEKEQLVKEKYYVLSKPEKGVKPILNSEYVVPENWTTCQLVDICRAFGRIGFRGYTKNDLVSGPEFGAISLSPSNMKETGMVYNDCTYITWDKYEESPEIKIENGDILIVKTGSSYGKTVLVKNLPHKATINPQIAVIKDIKINPDYLQVFLQSPSAKNNYEEFVLGTSIPTFSQLNLLSMEIPLPPLAEQHRIVEKIEELMPLVDMYDKAQAELEKLNTTLPEALKKSILQEAIQGKLVPQDPNDEPASVLLEKIRKEKEQLVKEGKLKKKDLETTPVTDEEKPFEIPESWEWVRIKEICTKIVDGDHNPPPGLPFKTDYLMLSSKNINDDRLVALDSVRYLSKETFEEENERTKVEEGDLFFTSVGTLGRSCIFRDKKINVSFQRSVSVLSTLIFNDFLKRTLDSPYIQNYIIDNATGTAQKGFYLNQLEKVIIPLPPLAEQHRIVAKIEELFKLLKN